MRKLNGPQEHSEIVNLKILHTEEFHLYNILKITKL